MLDELYDLRNDPQELNNRYDDASARSVRDELKQRLETWMHSINDPLLEDRKYDPSVNSRQPEEGDP